MYIHSLEFLTTFNLTILVGNTQENLAFITCFVLPIWRMASHCSLGAATSNNGTTLSVLMIYLSYVIDVKNNEANSEVNFFCLYYRFHQ